MQLREPQSNPELKPGHLTQNSLLRAIADLLFVCTALLVAFSVHFIYRVVTSGHGDFVGLFWSHKASFTGSSWILSCVCLSIFTLSGFYTYGRAYSSRYQALVVAQSASLGYLAYGLMSCALASVPRIPLAVWMMAWLLTVVLMLAGRFWAGLWSGVVRSERHRRLRPESRRPHRILVIGGAGFIGSALLPKLLERGYEVRLLDLLLYGTESIDKYLSHPNLQLIQADFRQVDRVVEAMRDVDTVVHLGAIVGDPACALDEELTIEVNLMATRMIAEVAKGFGVNRFVFASTCSVYGASDEFLDERAVLNPISMYARSKIASERVLMSLSDPYFAPTCLRFGTIYGLSGRTRFDLVVNLLTAKAVMDGEITIYSGDQWRPFLHVDDAANSILLCLEAPLRAVREQVFNVGSSEQNYTIEQVGSMVQARVPNSRLVNKGTASDRRSYRVNFEKIKHQLGFAPQHTVEQGITEVLEAIRSGAVSDYRETRYSNVKLLSEEGLIPRQTGWAHDLIREAAPARPNR
jgi:nucleoside-diphosphate-sugar epimerase